MAKTVFKDGGRTHFTLIELLVVIAIIAVLSTILFPVLQSMREKGRATLCRSNIRQVALMHISYTDYSNGVFCPALDSDFNQWDASADYSSPGILSNVVLGADPGGDQVFQCPEKDGKLKVVSGWAPPFAGYAYNYLLSFRTFRDMPPDYREVKITQVHHPSELVIVADGACLLSGPDGMEPGPTSFLLNPSSHTGGYADFRHVGKSFAAAADGHVLEFSQCVEASGVPADYQDRVGYLSSKDKPHYAPY